jgi:TonB family protein
MAADAAAGGSQIFLSYRREDSIAHVNALFPPLRERFGRDRVFKDTDNIAPGEDFIAVIEAQLKQCSVFLPVIGKHWLTAGKPNANTRRLDDDQDYLRVEIATALRDDRILVIPVLVGGATMPGAADLPPDLLSLARRNAFELRDSRWESDVKLLIEAIARASPRERRVAVQVDSATTQAPPQPLPAEDHSELGALKARRARQLTSSLNAARLAFQQRDYETALAKCDDVIFLDPQHREAEDLRRRTRQAIDEVKIQAWLTEAKTLLQRADASDEHFGRVSDFVDKALALNPEHQSAMSLRRDLLSRRLRRERQFEAERSVQESMVRARTSLDEGDFDAAIEHCEHALTVATEHPEATRLRDEAVAARDDNRRRRSVERRAQNVVALAKADFEAGRRKEALIRLEQFIPENALVKRALEEFRRESVENTTHATAGTPPDSSLSHRSANSTDTTRGAVNESAPPEIFSTTPDSRPGIAPAPVAYIVAGLAVASVLSLAVWGWRASSQDSSLPTVPAASLQTSSPEPPANAPAPPASRPSDTSPSPKSSTTKSTKSEGKPPAGETIQNRILEAYNKGLTSPRRDTAPNEIVRNLRDQSADQDNVSPVRVGGTIKAPQRLKHVPPVYPPIAQSARVQGVVIVEATIGTDGLVAGATVVRSIPLLDQAALDAVRQWEFAPTLLDGKPVPVIMTVTVSFTLQ